VHAARISSSSCHEARRVLLAPGRGVLADACDGEGRRSSSLEDDDEDEDDEAIEMVMRRRARGVLVDLGAAAGREEGGLGPVGAGVLAVSVDVEGRVLLDGCKGEESGVSESESK